MAGTVEHGGMTTGVAEVLPFAVEEWLAMHVDAVMTVLFLVLGVDLVSKGITPLT